MGPTNAEEATQEIKNATFWLGLFALLYIVGVAVESRVSFWFVSNLSVLVASAVLLFRWPTPVTAFLALGALAPTLFVVARNDLASSSPLKLASLFCFFAGWSLLRVQAAVWRFPGVKPRIEKPRFSPRW